MLSQAIAARYGVLLEKAGIALRGLFIINPEGIIQQITINDLVSLTCTSTVSAETNEPNKPIDFW
jgi:alkyl hydroperoxide reductase subunit AhpC